MRLRGWTLHACSAIHLPTVLGEQHSYARMAGSDLDMQRSACEPSKPNPLSPPQHLIRQIPQISETTPEPLKRWRKCMKDAVVKEKHSSLKQLLLKHHKLSSFKFDEGNTLLGLFSRSWRVQCKTEFIKLSFISFQVILPLYFLLGILFSLSINGPLNSTFYDILFLTSFMY